jgi:hypothetical protein
MGPASVGLAGLTGLAAPARPGAALTISGTTSPCSPARSRIP